MWTRPRKILHWAIHLHNLKLGSQVTVRIGLQSIFLFRRRIRPLAAGGSARGLPLGLWFRGAVAQLEIHVDRGLYQDRLPVEQIRLISPLILVQINSAVLSVAGKKKAESL